MYSDQPKSPPSPGRSHAAIRGIGTYRPRRIVTNEEICETLDSSPEWIERRSGIRTRRFAQPDETLAEMAATAAAKALADAGVSPGDVDRLLVATMSEVSQPSTLLEDVAARLGVTTNAYRLSAACAGFTVGLALAGFSIAAGSARCCLVIGVERMTDIIDPRDRSTAFLFADGAGAAVVAHDTTPGIGPVAWGTRSDLGEAITVRPEAAHGGRPIMRMQGSTVFRWAVTSLPDIARTALRRSGVEAGDLRAFVPHQANLRITEKVAEELGLPETVAISRDIVDQGNTSAASIPLALDRMRTSGAVVSGDLALLIGFGAGITHAATVVRVP